MEKRSDGMAERRWHGREELNCNTVICTFYSVFKPSAYGSNAQLIAYFEMLCAENQHRGSTSRA